MDNLQAAILRVKLKKLESWNKKRIMNAKIYTEFLKNLSIITPKKATNNECNFHLYVIRVKKRTALVKYLESKGIKTGIHYPTPIHLQEAYEDLGYKAGDFPIAEKLSNEILSLPMFPELTKAEIKFICDEIALFYHYG